MTTPASRAESEAHVQAREVAAREAVEAWLAAQRWREAASEAEEAMLAVRAVWCRAPRW